MRTNDSRTRRAFRRGLVLTLLAVMVPGCPWLYPSSEEARQTAPIKTPDTSAPDSSAQSIPASVASPSTAD